MNTNKNVEKSPCVSIIGKDYIQEVINFVEMQPKVKVSIELSEIIKTMKETIQEYERGN